MPLFLLTLRLKLTTDPEPPAVFGMLATEVSPPAGFPDLNGPFRGAGGRADPDVRPRGYA
jgi:hypothetical protein